MEQRELNRKKAIRNALKEYIEMCGPAGDDFIRLKRLSEEIAKG